RLARRLELVRAHQPQGMGAVLVVLVDAVAGDDGGHHHEHRDRERQQAGAHQGWQALSRSRAVSDCSCASVGFFIATTRVAWPATAASNRLRASRPLPKPLSRGWASKKVRILVRAPSVHT